MENNTQSTAKFSLIATAVKVFNKSDVKRVKNLLETEGINNSREKIRFDSELGCFLLPAVVSLDSESNGAGESLEEVDIRGERFQLLGALHVSGNDSDNTKTENADSTTPSLSASNSSLRPVVDAILASDSSLSTDVRALMVSSISTKYSVYPPLVLFNYGMFGAKDSAGAAAWDVYLGQPARSAQFFEVLLARFFNRSTAAKKKIKENIDGVLTHVAENWPIPDKTDILRLPSRISLLYPVPSSSSDADSASADEKSLEGNMEELWCTVTQNGIKQTWAPKHTMFSRGNIKEKARVLQFASVPAAGTDTGSDDPEGRTMAVDLYAGIGYFTFSYAASHRVRTVLCWELNPWSIKGLVRGARLNKWQPIPVQHLNSDGAALLQELRELEQYFVFAAKPSKAQLAREDAMPAIADKTKKKRNASDVNIIVFAEDNIHAFDRVQAILGQGTVSQNKESDDGVSCSDNYRGLIKRPLISHINMGLLPHAHLAFPVAVQLALLSGLPVVALHVHENVAVADFDAWVFRTTAALQNLVDTEGPASGSKKADTRVVFTHLEKIKTYAPGVWHVCGDFNIVKGDRCP